MHFVTDARRGRNRTIEEYQINGTNWVSKEEAISMAEQDRLDNAIVVHPNNRSPYLRSLPDHKKNNNFSEMAKS